MPIPKRALLLAAAALTIPAARAQSSNSPAPVSCPPTLNAPPFERISVFNKEGDRVYDLAPDDTKQLPGRIIQTWNVSDYRDLPVFLTCHYHGATRTITKPLPAPIRTCAQTLPNSPRQPSTMSCR